MKELLEPEQYPVLSQDSLRQLALNIKQKNMKINCLDARLVIGSLLMTIANQQEEHSKTTRDLEISRAAMNASYSLAERLALDAIAALAGAGIATPERGYTAEPYCLKGDIERLARERDEAKTENMKLREVVLNIRRLMHLTVVDHCPARETTMDDTVVCREKPALLGDEVTRYWECDGCECPAAEEVLTDNPVVQMLIEQLSHTTQEAPHA